jgi:hypothetical protein
MMQLLTLLLLDAEARAPDTHTIPSTKAEPFLERIPLKDSGHGNLSDMGNSQPILG